VFAAKGYHHATVAEICRRARANIASVNYHFRDKASLYVEVWRDAASQALRLYPLDGGVADDAPAENRLRGLLLSLLKRMTDRSLLGAFHRLRLMEMSNPTGLIDDVCLQIIRPLREHTRALLQELAGQPLSEQELDYCELAVVGPCLMAQMARQHKDGTGVPLLPTVQAEPFVDHCVRLAKAAMVRPLPDGAPIRRGSK